MNEWAVIYTPKAQEDLLRLDKSVRARVLKTIARVRLNPLPVTEGGYGKPLSGELSGCLKVKFRRLGIRVVYRLHRTEHGMEIIVVGMRADSEVYAIAAERLKQMITD